MDASSPFTSSQSICGCYYYKSSTCVHLPQVALKAHATILSSAARTTLTQTFANLSDSILEEASYKFPLYDGVSVVGFQCRVGTRLLHSKVKTKEQANTDYESAIANDESAAIMDHSDTENDVFYIRLGNVPAKETVTVDITFVGELKQDAEADGIRYTLPNSIAPRYQGSMVSQNPDSGTALPASLQGISITADVLMEKTSVLRELHSPSHSIKVSLGKTSSLSPDTTSYEPSQASATLRLCKDDRALLERDFVLVVKADGLDKPRAMLESHPTIPGQKAVMATLVPKFSLPPVKPEIVFVVDRSASMRDKIPTLKSALMVFLKSLPVGVCFNICSFGTRHEFLWSSSKTYDSSSLQDALSYIESIASDMGGTELSPAVENVTNRRLKDRDLEVLILTDGQISYQQSLFRFIRENAADNTARFFGLGIGDAASHSLIEGIGRSGNGISQTVIEYEELDRKVVRMLKGALTPHIYDYKLEVKYDTGSDQEFEIVDDIESTADSMTEIGEDPSAKQPPSNTISLFDDNFTEADSIPQTAQIDDEKLFLLSAPKVLQAPHRIPSLYPFIRTTVYLLLDPDASERIPQTLSLSATSKQGPLHLTIPISNIGKGETIHQLASRKAVIELEEHHGWLEDASDNNNNPFHRLHENTKQRIAARECQKLGIKYQVTGKYCSFVALEDKDSTESNHGSKEHVTQVHYHPEYQGVVVGKKKKTKGSPRTAIRFMDSRSQPPPLHQFRELSTRTVHPGNIFAKPLWRGGRGGGHPGGFGGGSWGGGSSASSDRAFGSTAHSGQSQPLFGRGSSHPAFSAFNVADWPAQASAGGNSAPSNASPSPGIFAMSATPASQSPRSPFGIPASQDEAPISTSRIHQLIEMQSFEGKWLWNQALFDLLCLDMDETMTRINALLGKTVHNLENLERGSVFATLLALGFIARQDAKSKDVSGLVQDKAQTWLDDRLDLMGEEGELIRSHQTHIKTLV